METKVLIKREFSEGYYVQEEKRDWFVKLLRLDVNKAIEEWERLQRPIYSINTIEWFNKYFNQKKEKYQKYAESKWKRPNKQIEYINSCIQSDIYKMAQSIISGWDTHSIKYFDFKVFPGTQGINEWCIIRKERLDDESLIKCWEIIRESEYFQHAQGWQLEYDGHTRPQIKMILPKEWAKKAEQAEESLSRAIENFYSNSNYWGD